MNKFMNKLFFGFAIGIASAIITIPLISCSSDVSSEKPVAPNPNPPIEPNPNPPIEPNPPINPVPPSNFLYDYERFYDVKKAKFQDDYYAGLIDNNKPANSQYAESHVHFVPEDLSKLPSFFTSNDILSLIDLKDTSVVPSSIDIIDYNDSLRTSGIQNWFEDENTFPSTIPHTDTSGRAKYKIIPVDVNYKIKPGNTISSNYDYSYLDVNINFLTPTENIVNHTFKHTFLFSEGINEVRYGRTTVDGSLPLILSPEQKTILGNDRTNSQFIVETLTADNTYTTFDIDVLKHFVEIKHMKPSTRIDQFKSDNYIDGVRVATPLPSNLPYTPVLKNENNDRVVLYSKNTIIFSANDTNNNNPSDALSVKWHNFGKLGAKDTFHRSRSSYGGIGLWNNELSWLWGS